MSAADLSDALRARVLPVLVLGDAGRAAAIGAALVRGGLPTVEVTLRTPAAPDVIRELTQVRGLVVAAGTVVRQEQVSAVVDAGATFVVTPGLSRDVIRECGQLGVPVVPGVATATEVIMALDEGLSLVKFFPAETLGGPAAVRALSAPFPGLAFLPTGGINRTTMRDYLALSAVPAVGGSWMFPTDALAEGRVDLVERLAMEAAAEARRVA